MIKPKLLPTRQQPFLKTASASAISRPFVSMISSSSLGVRVSTTGFLFGRMHRAVARRRRKTRIPNSSRNPSFEDEKAEEKKIR